VEVGVTGKQAVEKVLEIAGDIQVVADSTADERHEICSTVACGNAADHEPIFAAQGHLLHQLFGVVVVDRHEAVVEIHDELIVVIPKIAECLAELLVRQHVGDGWAFDVFGNLRPERSRFGVAKRLPIGRREFLPAVFDVVELLEPGEQTARVNGMVVGCLQHLPPGVRHAGRAGEEPTSLGMDRFIACIAVGHQGAREAL
jgi:hypothetical protein